MQTKFSENIRSVKLYGEKNFIALVLVLMGLSILSGCTATKKENTPTNTKLKESKI